MFYFVLPIATFGMFENTDAYHFILLIVEFVRILNKTCVSETDLERCTKILKCWHKLVPVFLNMNAFTFNVHSLIHLPDQVRRFGSTWSINTSVFESWIGWLKTLRTGSVNTLSVIMRRFLDFKHLTVKKKLSTRCICPVGYSKFIKLGNYIVFLFLTTNETESNLRI